MPLLQGGGRDFEIPRTYQAEFEGTEMNSIRNHIVGTDPEDLGVLLCLDPYQR